MSMKNPLTPAGIEPANFPDYMTTAQGGDKVVNLTHRPLFTPRRYSWYSFLLEAESTPILPITLWPQGHSVIGRILCQ